MRDHSHHVELTREEAVEGMLRLVDEAQAFNPRVEQVSVADSIGRVLARDAVAQVDVPDCRTCNMDSIAVHWSAFEGTETGQVPDTSAWVRGVDWEFANTGVAMPEGFDTAVVVEHVEVSDDQQHVRIMAAPSKQFAGTSPAGNRMHQGDVIASAGTLVTPDVAACIASGNNATATVVARPKVAFIPTGNELVPAGVPFASASPERFAARGRNFESNGVLVRGKVEAWGGEFVPFGIVADDFGQIREAVLHACEVADIVVLNAGSSKGSDDWCVEVLEELGQVVCHQTNHGPGHHSSYALVEGTPVVGISGPPAGASFTLNFYLRPVMMRWLGLSTQPQRVPVRLTAPFPKGGPGHGPAKPGAAMAGEVRPPEPGVAKGFFAIKFLKVEPASGGTLQGAPLPGRPGSPECESANAYYMLPTGEGTVPPAAGDVIWVEFR